MNGTELEFFHGARRTLSASQRITLIVSLSPRLPSEPNRVCDELRDMGFTLFDIRQPGKRELDMHRELDCIFAHK